MKILYFAWLRRKIGKDAEEVALPAGVADVAGVVAWLKGRGGGYAEALADDAAIRAAVNRTYAGPDTPVGDDDEVAFFPPVTGG